MNNEQNFHILAKFDSCDLDEYLELILNDYADKIEIGKTMSPLVDSNDSNAAEFNKLRIQSEKLVCL